MLRCALLLTLASPAATVTPVEKVISLLTGLKKDVEAEGRQEAEVYEKFACFCRDTTQTKSKSILDGRDSIQSLSATIADGTADREAKQADLQKRKGEHEALTKQLKDAGVALSKERGDYEARALDLTRAIHSLQSAIKAVKDSKPTASATAKKELEQDLALAQTLQLVPEAKWQDVQAFLQVDPSDPTYQFHSSGILKTLDKLLSEFSEDKHTLDTDWAATEKTYNSLLLSLNTKLADNQSAMDQLSVTIEELRGSTAAAKEALTNAQSLLQDDQQYMSDLTDRCQARAKDWDQRSGARAEELKALGEALLLLEGKVKGLDSEVNQRADAFTGEAPAVETPVESGTKELAEEVPPVEPVVVDPVVKEPSLAGISTRVASPSFLQTGTSKLRGGQSSRARRDKVSDMLVQEGQRLGSATLAQLAISLKSDPFIKVQKLIQQLVERLLAEANEESTKRGFCDEQLARAQKDRDARLHDTQKLDVEIQGLEVKLSELTTEVEELSDTVDLLQGVLKKTSGARDAEHLSNVEAIKKAKEGENAVVEAIMILKAFYAKSAKATAFVQASPVDEDTAGAGFRGDYQGKQERSKGVIGLLEVIKSDFQRSYRFAEAAEKQAGDAFDEFDRASRADIGGKETKKSLDMEDADATRSKLTSKFADLTANQALLDIALKRVEELKPTCMDTGMSCEDRVSKREEEVAALKKALCTLDKDRVEPECLEESMS